MCGLVLSEPFDKVIIHHLHHVIIASKFISCTKGMKYAPETSHILGELIDDSPAPLFSALRLVFTMH